MKPKYVTMDFVIFVFVFLKFNGTLKRFKFIFLYQEKDKKKEFNSSNKLVYLIII